MSDADPDNTKGDDIEKARFDFYNSFGKANPLIIAPLINPFFQGGPNWPTRPSWKSIKLEEGFAWATNGLADPWSNPEMFNADSLPGDFNLDTGLGIELICGSKDLDQDALRQAVINASHTLAGNPFILKIMSEALKDQNKQLLGDFAFEPEGCVCAALSTTVKASFPEEFQMKDGQVGVMIDQGLSVAPSFETPHGVVQVLEMVILFPHELEWILALGDPARNVISRRLHARNDPWISSAKRKPCVSKSIRIPTEKVESFEEGIQLIRETWTTEEED